MRLAAALAALFLQTAPTVAQTTTTTTDVYEPTILSAAGNVTGLPGGNEVCGSTRVRKPWHALTSAEQALYLEATQRAIASGGVASFAAISADSVSQAQGEYSCGLFTWYRRLLLAYESYLRDLDERFACLTLPYYDVHTAYIQSANGACSNMFECSGIFQDIGGAPNSTVPTTLVLDGVNATGYIVNGAPYNNQCNSSSCGYVVRDDLTNKSVPSAASFSSFLSVVATSADYATFLENVKYGVHNEVLDAFGGTFSTAVAARDVLFYSWYTALDMYLHVYHLCRIGVPVTYEQIIESLETYANATQTCGGVDGVDANSPIIMRISLNGSIVDVSEHPTLGKYFGFVGNDNWNYADVGQLGDYSYTYQLPEVLRQQILSNNDMCTGFNRAFAASYTSLNATAVKNTTTTRTTTRTTTTKTTRIVDGKRVTTTNVTTTTTRSNSTGSSMYQSTITSGQLMSSYNGYSYLGNFSTNNRMFGEGTIVTNGYTGYMPFYTNGEITTKHNGILCANFTSNSNGTTTNSTDMNTMRTTNAVVNVTVGSQSVTRNVTVSIATSGSYWAWLQAAYDGLYTRFDGNVDLVAMHMKLLECYTFESIHGLSNLSTTFVTNRNLVTNRVECGQHLDLVRSGLQQLAVRSTSYSASSLEFADSSVISTILSSYRRVTSRNTTFIRTSYINSVKTLLTTTQMSLANVTVATTRGSEFSTESDTNYIISNVTSNTVQSGRNASDASTTTSTLTTTTTADNLADTIQDTSSNTTENSATTGAWSSGTVSNGSTETTTTGNSLTTEQTDESTTDSTTSQNSNYGTVNLTNSSIGGMTSTNNDMTAYNTSLTYTDSGNMTNSGVVQSYNNGTMSSTYTTTGNMATTSGVAGQSSTSLYTGGEVITTNEGDNASTDAYTT
ncbi:putative tyrosinase copper-binding domain-containing protein [Plasmopara halstedii]